MAAGRTGGVALFGRLDHQAGGDLPERVGAESDGDELEQLGDDLLIESLDLEVAAAQAALAEEALGTQKGWGGGVGLGWVHGGPKGCGVG